MKYFLRILHGTGRHRHRAGLFCLLMMLCPLSAVAAPSVVVSIKPLHALAAAVMQGVGTPDLIVQGAGFPHGYQLRPDDAKKIAAADIIFWAGPQMETFLIKPFESLSPGAQIVSLADAPGVQLLDMRSGGNFELNHHGDEQQAHDEGEDHHKDLHFWLDPQNAKAATARIAYVLAAKDPANAWRYYENAKAYENRLDSLTAEVTRELAPFHGRHFIVFHDGYQYFEKRFGMSAAGSITVNPEQAPGVRRVAEIRDKVKRLGSVCVFSEPQFEPRVVNTVVEGTSARTGVLDPLGAGIAPGPDQYPELISNLADSLKHCFSGGKA